MKRKILSILLLLCLTTGLIYKFPTYSEASSNDEFIRSQTSEKYQQNPTYYINVNGHELSIKCTQNYGSYGTLYADGKYIDDNVSWNFLSNGYDIYYTKKNSGIYRADIKTGKKELILNEDKHVSNVYKNKYLYYSSSKYQDTTRTMADLIIYDIEQKKEVTYITNAGFVDIINDKIYTTPAVGVIAELTLTEMNPDGTEAKVIAEDAFLTKPINGQLYYSAVENGNDSFDKIRGQVRKYNPVTGQTTILTEYAYGSVAELHENYAIMSSLVGDYENYRVYYKKEIKVVLNGEEIKFDQPPVMISDRVMVPIRAIAEKMGDTVKWSEKDNSALIIHPDRMVVFKNNHKSVVIAKEPEFDKWEHYDLDVPAQIVGSRTLTPVRAIGECLGAKVEWDGETQTVKITSNKNINKTITDEKITKFNVYYSLTLKDNLFAEFSPEIKEFYESRNDWADAFIIWWDDWFLGVDNLISGEENNVYMIKNCLAEIFSELPDNKEINMSTEIEITNWLSSGLSYLSYVDFTKVDKVVNISPHTANALSKFGNALDKAGLKLELTGVAFETVCKMLSDYTTGITYIDLIRETLKEANINDDVFYEALDDLENEYTNSFLSALADGAKDGIISIGTFVISTATGGLFSLASFSKDTINAMVGYDDTADAVKNIHCMYWFNKYIDKAELSIKTDAYTNPEKINDYIKIFNFQKIIKKKLYQSMDMLKDSKDENIVNKIQEQLNKIDNMSYIVWK
ncbi:MAG: copper amine oxidase N-terminal domain-containing protein [Ruminococcaceae bacterium]|nr:copper amine oxidase N-terminal domain-containing protein [Oscillospiraceae bacterium]